MSNTSNGDGSYLRLSVAILIGDGMRSREPRTYLMEPNCGCAIGGAMMTRGIDPHVYVCSSFDLMQQTRRELWPWIWQGEVPGHIFQSLQQFVQWLPEDWKPRFTTLGGLFGGRNETYMGYNFAAAIGLLFFAVCNPESGFTIEQLADKVREWEEQYDPELQAAGVKSAAESIQSFDAMSEIADEIVAEVA